MCARIRTDTHGYARIRTKAETVLKKVRFSRLSLPTHIAMRDHVR